MLFSSIPFLYYFLPCAIALCLLVPKRWRNVTLFLCSCVFYAYGEPKNLLLMLSSIAIGQVSALLIYKWKKEGKNTASIVI